MGKVKATTILETIIAMIIILVVFLIAGTIFLNISKSGLSEKKIKASEAINNYFNQLKIDQIPYELNEEVNGFLIKTDIENYGERPGVVLVHCQALDFGKIVITEQKRLILINK